MSKKKEITTRKAQKIVGKQTYINQQTGELIEMNVMEIEERDANFHKIWLGHIVQALDIIGNKKIKVINFIMENMNNENLFIMTQREMEKQIDVSLFTITETIKALQEANFLKKKQSGVYEVNPDVIFKGGKNKRMDILLRYKNLSLPEETTEDDNGQQTLVKE